MTSETQHVIDAVAALDVWPTNKTQVRQQLGDGPTNETWLVTCDQKLFVLRLVKPFAATVQLSLENELRIVQAAQQEKLAPAVVASCVTRGIVLSRHEEGRCWTVDDLQDEQQLSRLADVLKRVHGMNCDVPLLDIRGALQSYAELSANLLANKWRDEALAQLELIGHREPVVCHNDLTAANIIDAGELYLIDWEFAGRGDPLFDLAVVVTHHALDARTADYLLSDYLGHCDDNAKSDLARWCDVYRSLLALWLSIASRTPNNSKLQQ